MAAVAQEMPSSNREFRVKLLASNTIPTSETKTMGRYHKISPWLTSLRFRFLMNMSLLWHCDVEILCAGTPSSRWMWKERSLISLSQTVQGQIPQARNLGKSESDIDDAI